MSDTRLEVEFIKGIYNKLPNKTLSEIVTKNMREIGTPEYTDEEMEFAEKISETIPANNKRDSLWSSKRPGWEELIDVNMDRSIPDNWTDGLISHGSTDVAEVSWNTPTLEFNTATYPLGLPGHSWQNVALSGMSIGHKSMQYASKIIATSALDLLTKPELLNKAKETHKEKLRGRTYKSPVSPEARPPLDQWLNKS